MSNFVISKGVLLWKRQSGVTLIELMVVVLVIGFGVLAVVKFQAVAMRATGFSQEREVAVSLAESKLEQLRSYRFTSKATNDCGGKVVHNDCYRTYGGLESGEESVSEMAQVYQTEWSIQEVGAAEESGSYRQVLVDVSWGENSISVASVIGRNSPESIGGLMRSYTPPGNMVQPFSRVIKVPIPAVNIPNNRSRFSVPGSGLYVDLDNSTGEVVDGNIALTIDNKETYYLVSGYIGFSGNGVSPASSINIIITGLGHSDFKCYDDSGALQAYPGYITYSCVVRATKSSEADESPSWSGVLRLVLDDKDASALYGWGNGNNDKKVCAYKGTPMAYVDVSETLANQNFLIIGSGACPSETKGSDNPTDPNYKPQYETYKFQPA